MKRGTSSCFTSFDLPAARYRVAINVYQTSADATAGSQGHLKVVDFSLPATGDVLTVPLAAADDVCDAGGNASACPSASRDVACNLSQQFSWHWDGGLVAYSDTVQLDPNASYTRTRTKSDTHATTTCTVSIPRCSRDARVVTTFDIARAFDDPDVKAALAMSGTLVYGIDPRAYDGSIVIVSNTKGTIGIGADCDPAAGNQFCTRVVPPGVAALRLLLVRLDNQSLKSTECAVL